MPSSLSLSYQFSNPNTMQINQRSSINVNPSSRKRPHVVRCCSHKQLKASENFYELLGVSVDSSPQEIKSAYRNLQKKYHPDIAGEQGHESTLLLNKAYQVLIRDDLRKDYDATIGRAKVRVGIGSDRDAVGSIWKGALRPQALFVDENACIGCRECVHHACNTFMMDEVIGTARVKVQYGDEDDRIQTSVESCPVNCIHWVETEDLTVLEYLIQPQPKSGYGIYGQGWERPANVFMAAKSFHKQADNQAGKPHEYEPTKEEETPAQAQARESAYRELKIGTFSRMWGWLKENTGL